MIKNTGPDVYGFSKGNISEEDADVKRTKKDRLSKVSSSDLVREGKESRGTIARINRLNGSGQILTS